MVILLAMSGFSKKGIEFKGGQVLRQPNGHQRRPIRRRGAFAHTALAPGELHFQPLPWFLVTHDPAFQA
jgi:hypothetical protein